MTILDKFDDSNLIKKNEDFIRNLSKSKIIEEKVKKFINQRLMSKGYNLYNFGFGVENGTHHYTGVKELSKTDYILRDNNLNDLLYVDIKGKRKSNYVGWINIRDAIAYLLWTEKKQLPVVCFCCVEPAIGGTPQDIHDIKISSNQLYYFVLTEPISKPIKYLKAWDGNKIAIFQTSSYEDFELNLDSILKSYNKDTINDNLNELKSH